MRLLAVALLLLLPASAAAQSVQQSGTVTPGHLPVWATTGVVQDGGTSTAGKINSLGLYGNGGTPFCITNKSSPAPFTGGYTQLCLGASGTAAYLTNTSYGGATHIPFQIIVNGTTVVSFDDSGIILSTPLPVTSGGTGLTGGTTGNMLYFSAPTTLSQLQVGAGLVISGGVLSATGGGAAGGQGTVRQITSGVTDTVFSSDVTLAWDSATNGAKTSTLFACAPSLSGRVFFFKDERGNSSTYPIYISPVSGTVDGQVNYVLNSDLSSVTLQCDGVDNWMVM